MDDTPSSGDASSEFIGQVTRCQRQLYAFIFSQVLRATDAEDVLQETNLVLWQKSAEFQPGTNFLAWAFRVAQFQVMAFRKKKQRAREHFDAELIALLADEAQQRLQQFDARHQAMLDCMQRLPDEQRRLIAQRYQPGGSVKEMAIQCGRKPNAVSEALRRIREALRRCIERKLAAEGR